ncbi:putative amino-acid ABC transporter periplasmic-binding protein y4tE [Litchfieldella qijiaojingensis]|uniref:Amino-acid ABC transporter periplasmic-binding protein y4tE n=1 Tax=Litchfieldella qijiaojingensis TaxID=980347 RepID=A0ABQ2YBT7_9GAMM|nr:ectoine/hydroxyectoine ABC transporter substrate-binding protein EhuB [Halomonas qijiaojingensis]GGX77352.1 putative amino-acid ABC transporter periplasmic-binding protein y4tE [Halomonas qijiaojingensis]
MQHDTKRRMMAPIIAVAISWLFVATAHAATLEELQDQGSIRIAVANEVPYGYLDDNGEAKGAGPEVAKPIIEALEIGEIEWVATTFGDLISGLQEGRFDMTAAEMAILPERCRQMIYSEPTTSYGEGLLVKASNPQEINAYNDFAERDDITVAVLDGADQREILQALGVPESRMVVIENNTDAIDAIVSGRADAYAATGLTVTELENQDQRVEVALSFVDPVIDGEEVRSWGGFTFPKGAESLRDAVNRELASYKNTPDWEQTLSKHGFTQDDILNSFKYTTEELCNK